MVRTLVRWLRTDFGLSVGRLRVCLETTLAKLEANFGFDFGSTLGEPWVDFGPTLGRLWADSGLTLGRLWVYFGWTLAQLSDNLGSILDRL